MQVSSTTEALQDATRHIQVLHLDRVSRKPLNMEANGRKLGRRGQRQEELEVWRGQKRRSETPAGQTEGCFGFTLLKR